MRKIVHSAVNLPDEPIKILEGAAIERHMFDELGTPLEALVMEHSKDVDAIISGGNVKIASKIMRPAKISNASQILAWCESCC